MDQVFTDEVVVPVPRDVAFDFFATPRNLEAITPPWLRFRIQHESAPAPGEGVEYTYGLLLHGLPIRWKSRITDWQPGEQFVDIQLKGPYARWHHLHTFEDVPGGTRIVDEVTYRLRFGWLGQLVAGRWVENDVRKIFDYRKQRIMDLLAGSAAATG